MAAKEERSEALSIPVARQGRGSEHGAHVWAARSCTSGIDRRSRTEPRVQPETNVKKDEGKVLLGKRTFAARSSNLRCALDAQQSRSRPARAFALVVLKRLDPTHTAAGVRHGSWDVKFVGVDGRGQLDVKVLHGIAGRHAAMLQVAVQAGRMPVKWRHTCMTA